MTDKQIIDEERMFECVWCKYGFKESDANFILSENPNECVCSGCITEWADNLLCDLKRKEQECEGLKELVKKQKDVLIHKTILADEYESAYSFENLKVAKLKYCLAEIKEIAEALDCKNPEKCWVNDISITGDCWGCEPDKYEEPRDLADCPSHLAHIILQKISEVEE